MTPLPSKSIGRTPLRTTLLGLGTAPLAGNLVDVSEADGRAAMQAAFDGGVRYFDAAPLYGYGRAERRLGDFLRSVSDGAGDGAGDAAYALSTKAGRLLTPLRGPRPAGDPWQNALPFQVVWDYSYDGIMRSFEDSLQRLGLPRIDLLLLHDLERGTHRDDQVWATMFDTAMKSGTRALAELKASGDLQAVGLGVNESQPCLDALDHGDWDCFLLAGRYTLLEQDPLDDLLPACLERGVSLVIGGPYNSGLLAGGDTWNYVPAPRPQRDRARRLAEVCTRHGVDLKAAALQFPLAHASVASVIPGARSAAEALQNARQLEAPIPADLWQELRAEGLLRPDAPVPTGGLKASP